MKRVSFAEEMLKAHKNSKSVSDYRAKYDTNHSVEFGQYNREDNIAANLEYVANVIAQLVAVTIYHLFNLKYKNCQKSIERNEAIVLKRIVKNITRYTVCLKINILYKKNCQG